MLTTLHSIDEKHAPDAPGDRAPRNADLAKEFKHTKAGIWDAYEQIPAEKFGINIPGVSKLFRHLEFVEDLPFVWRMVKDVAKIKSCFYYLCLFIFVKVLASLEPAVALWYVAQRSTSIRGNPDIQRSGSPATISPLCVTVHPLRASPHQNHRSKWLWMSAVSMRNCSSSHPWVGSAARSLKRCSQTGNTNSKSRWTS